MQGEGTISIEIKKFKSRESKTQWRKENKNEVLCEDIFFQPFQSPNYITYNKLNPNWNNVLELWIDKT